MVSDAAVTVTSFPTEFVSELTAAIWARKGQPLRGGKEVRFCCPSHDDEHPSARYSPTELIWHCDVCQSGGGALDLAERLDVARPRSESRASASTSLARVNASRIVAATYDYTDEGETLLYRAIRYEPKSFSQSAPDGRASLDGIRRVLYKLPNVVLAIESDLPVWGCEGEKDADALTSLGLCGTTSPMGAGKFRPEYADSLRGGTVRWFIDNDEPGRKHGQDVAQKCAGKVASFKILAPPAPHKDVSDWIESGATRQDIERLAEETPEWQAAPSKTKARPSGPGVVTPAILPTGGFLKSYVDYASSLTDAPPIFHLAVGLAVLSAALGRRAWTVGLGGERLFTHHWSVIVGRSSYFRKTTAINIGLGRLKGASPELVHPNDFSKERFLTLLGKSPEGVVPASEFAATLSSFERSYNEGMKEILTELYDAPEIWRRELKAETITVNHPTITILGGSTLDWLQKSIKDGDVRGGFAARILFWPATEKPQWKGLGATSSQSLAGSFVTHKLSELIGHAETEMCPTPDALAFFNDWLKRHEDEDPNMSLQGFHVRLETAALKMAMLYEISAGDGTIPQEISRRSFEYGTTLADTLWQNVQVVVEQGFGRSRLGDEIEKTRGLLKAAGRMAHSDLLKRTRFSAEELAKVIDTLEETGEVEVDKSTGSGRGRKQITYTYVSTDD